MGKKKYVIRWHENTQGWREFDNLGEARVYASNVSRYHSPYECTINEYDGDRFIRIKHHYILGMCW